ncbi:DUF5606 domain-containing protein [Alistipes sp. ZOR0009]|jgi:hypothetical protein|uniref:DUF5606 family protein n=1 Tax=Alistipes sp. ZOR0009 TaxID=1339253 RepID=UPI0006486899|nr:DUF5606 domain-containing protein [Alistipes sp. ZOR0009]
MDLRKILAVAGYPGLYQFVAQGRNGIIVESLEDKKRSNIPASAKVSALGEIAIYTDSEEIALQDVLLAIKEKMAGGPALDAKKATNDQLKKAMEEVLPSYDRERVYASDMKKLFLWYNILQSNDMLDFEVVEETEESAEE